MAHGVGDGQVQGVAVEGVVEGVAGDAVGGDQAPARANSPASQEGAEGRSWRWISAARLTGVVRWPQCAEQRREIVGLQANRAPVILAGACIVRSILAKLGRESLTVSDRGLRHGLLVERFPHPR